MDTTALEDIGEEEDIAVVDALGAAAVIGAEDGAGEVDAIGVVDDIGAVVVIGAEEDIGDEDDDDDLIENCVDRLDNILPNIPTRTSPSFILATFTLSTRFYYYKLFY